MSFDQEGHDVGQAHRGFFGVAETGDGLALDQRQSVRVAGIFQHAGRVAHGGYGLARAEGRFDQGNGVAVLREVPKRAMPAG
jgi:hypothetical protein